YLMLLLPSTSTLFPYTTLFRSRADAAGGSDGAAVEAGLPHRQDPSDAVPGAEHRQCAVLRGHRGVGGGVDADSRLGVRQPGDLRSEEHTSELQSRENLVCRLLL